jgi:hypothetical protein
MNAAPKPDAVVREQEARASVEELTKGLSDDAHHNGILPPIAEIERFAKDVTREQIAIHEDRFRHGVPDAKVVARGQGTGSTIDRGAFSDDFGTVTKVERAFDSKRHAAKAKTIPLAEAFEARLVDMRIAHLLSYVTPEGRTVRHPSGPGDKERHPEWAARIRKAYSETLAMSKNLDLPKREAESNAADAVLQVLEASNATFGDWRHPKGPDGKPLYFVAKVMTNGE